MTSRALFFVTIVSWTWVSTVTLGANGIVARHSMEVQEGDTSVLSCPSVVPGFLTVVWTLPGDDDEGESRQHGVGAEFDFDHRKYNYLASNGSLLIRGITSADAGTYVCHVQVSSSPHLEGTVELIIKSQRSLWEAEYKDNLIRGLIVAAFTASFFAIFCAVYKYRWKQIKPPGNDEEHQCLNQPHGPVPTLPPALAVTPASEMYATPPFVEQIVVVPSKKKSQRRGVDNPAVELDYIDSQFGAVSRFDTHI